VETHAPAAPEPARVLIATGQEGVAEQALMALEALGRSHAVRGRCAKTSMDAIGLAGREQPEVALVDLVFEGSAGPALGIEIRKWSPHVEVIFLADSMESPEARAARDIGLSRIVDVAALPQWLPTALGPLCTIARAGRQLAEARDALNLPQPTASFFRAHLPLAVAEKRYRETYLRACLVQAGSRPGAARLAGVPYSSMVVMLRKLGIPGSGQLGPPAGPALSLDLRAR
jgi:CheY-like chemotaxis protein